MNWTSRHTLFLEAELKATQERHAKEIAVLRAEKQQLFDKVERLERAIFAQVSIAGANYVERTEPSEPPAAPTQSEQGTPWQRVRKREIARLELEYQANEKRKADARAAGAVPTPAESKPGEAVSH
jgi:hypothetical protein